MAVIIDGETRVIVQGITGHQGRTHTKAMLEYGTRIVAGVTPGKGGENVYNVPVFDTMKEAVSSSSFRGDVDVVISFVPAPYVFKAFMEAIDVGVRRMVVVAEHVPLHDEVKMVHLSKKYGGLLLGPNCPGICSPGKSKVGIMPNHIFLPPSSHRGKDKCEENACSGRADRGMAVGVGVVSRSGTLTYEIVSWLSRLGIAQSTVIGVGGDRIPGTTMAEASKLLLEDPYTWGLVVVGEIGGGGEEETALLAREYDKPVVAYIAGRTAPPEKRMGHAGALIGERGESASAKIEFLCDHGILVEKTPRSVAETVAREFRRFF